jgi:hypothetical protein
VLDQTRHGSGTQGSLGDAFVSMLSIVTGGFRTIGRRGAILVGGSRDGMSPASRAAASLSLLIVVLGKLHGGGHRSSPDTQGGQIADA